MRDERRKSRRFPVLGQQQQGTLRVGDVSITVRLLDQSATGFSIRSEDHPGVFPGEVVWLQTTAGWTEVRVVKTRHEVEGTQIGLERIADVASGPPSVGGILPEQLAQANPRSNHLPLLGFVAALSVVLGFLIWTAVGRQMKAGLESALPHSHEEVVDQRPAAVRAIENEASRRASELQKQIQEFSAAMLSLPEVVQTLQLSDDQQRRLRQIVQSAMKQEHDLRQKALSGDRTVESQVQKLRQTASQDAMQVLDAQQQEQWTTMFQAALEQLDSTRVRPGRDQ